MKKILLLSSLSCLSIFMYAQEKGYYQLSDEEIIQRLAPETSPALDSPAIIKRPEENSSHKLEVESRNPENTGSVKKIENGRIIYTKETPQITIEYKPE